MAERLRLGKCVHCLKEDVPTTDDHVFPSSWYPDITPPTVQRWTVPSCMDCNQKLGQLEKDLLVRLPLCIDPSLEAVSGLASKALRSLGLDADGLREEEKAYRDKFRAKIRSELMPYADVAGQPGAIPGCTLWEGNGETEPFAIPIPWAALIIIAEKIACGCEYKLKDRYVELPYGIRTFITNPNVVNSLFASFGRLIDFGPGCQVMRIFVTEDPKRVRYRIAVWGLCVFTFGST